MANAPTATEKLVVVEGRNLFRRKRFWRAPQTTPMRQGYEDD